MNNVKVISKYALVQLAHSAFGRRCLTKGEKRSGATPLINVFSLIVETFLKNAIAMRKIIIMQQKERVNAGNSCALLNEKDVECRKIEIKLTSPLSQI